MPDLGPISPGLSWPEVRSSLEISHPDFFRFFSPLPLEQLELEQQACLARSPVQEPEILLNLISIEVLDTTEAEVHFNNHVNALEIEFREAK